MKRIIFTLSALALTLVGNAQTATKTHVVVKGETITQIAKKYQTTNNVIFLLNPEAVEGISENQILKIPTSSDLHHEVQPKETVYGIAKQYNIAIDKLYELNPGLKEGGLKIGQQLNLSENNKVVISNVKDASKGKANFSTITIPKGETIYSLAVNYNTTVSKLEELNPGLLERGLKAGQEINIPSQETKTTNKNLVATTNDVKPSQIAKKIVIKPKETIYNITKTYGVSHEQLLKWNPEIINGLKEGADLIVGYDTIFEKVALPSAVVVKERTDLALKENSKVKLNLVNDGATKDLVMLLPFNVAKNNFNNANLNQNIKNDVFLNMTLDFYAGAKLAIQHLKSKNYNLNVTFVDSKETNRSLDVSTLKSDFDFQKTDVIIGPFFQKNVDAVSEAFKGQSTIIVSPLSTDKGKPYPKQVHAMPNGDIIKNEVIEYVLSKQERVIAITDGKKTNTKFYNNNYPTINVLSVNADQKVNQTNLVTLLSKEVTNYVVYDATSLTTTVELVKSLRALQKDYKIQLVSLEKLDVLESSDIEMKDLVALKYTFPSVTYDVSSPKKDKFIKAFKAEYGKAPSRFATRGYDVTYDIISRMFESDDNSSIFEYGSQQTENKFTYINENGGVYNNAVYILYYDKDLTIKEAK